MQLDLEPYVRFDAEHVHPTIAGWFPAPAILDHVRTELVREVAQRTDPQRAAAFRLRCPVREIEPQAYMLRELDLGRDGRALAGINFVGMDRRRPFVGVRARSRALKHEAEVARLGERLRDEFAPFQPEAFRVWQCAADDGVAETSAARVDMRIIAGRLGELRTRRPPDTGARLELRPCDANEVYASYEATYARFFEAHPVWRGRIQVETRERLQEAQTQGVLRQAFVDGEPAGFFATLPAQEQALVGYVMLEEILDTPFRGRGLAQPLQRMLFDHIDASADTPVFGHIDGANQASLRTAMGVGRGEVYRTTWIPFQ